MEFSPLASLLVTEGPRSNNLGKGFKLFCFGRAVEVCADFLPELAEHILYTRKLDFAATPDYASARGDGARRTLGWSARGWEA